MSLKIYFLRHGETTYSRKGTFCGKTDPDLTAEGLQMAQVFAETYGRSVAWQAIFVSPMWRTLQTAGPIAEITGIPLQIKKELREIDYGLWEDREQEQVKQHYEQDYIGWLTEPAWNPPTGGETAVQVASRALPVIAGIESQYTDGNVLVVSHKATIRILLCSLLGIDLGRYRDRIDAKACSVSIVKFDKHGPMLELLGDRSYLPASLRERSGT